MIESGGIRGAMDCGDIFENAVSDAVSVTDVINFKFYVFLGVTFMIFMVKIRLFSLEHFYGIPSENFLSQTWRQVKLF